MIRKLFNKNDNNDIEKRYILIKIPNTKLSSTDIDYIEDKINHISFYLHKKVFYKLTKEYLIISIPITYKEYSTLSDYLNCIEYVVREFNVSFSLDIYTDKISEKEFSKIFDN